MGYKEKQHKKQALRCNHCGVGLGVKILSSGEHPAQCAKCAQMYGGLGEQAKRLKDGNRLDPDQGENNEN